MFSIRKWVMAFALAGFLTPAWSADFDHEYKAFGDLLASHVKWIGNGGASQVDYAGFAREKAALDGELARLSAVSAAQFSEFSRDQQLAFLINAYNAFTIDLILTEYPDLESIKDLGSFFSSPWKKEFFTLLGDKRHLDWVEHERIRERGVYDEPRIHFVVNCASIGCPALRPEPIRAANLEAQLQDSTRRFLSDGSRNRYNADSDELQVSKIFDWYGDDFELGHQGIASLAQFFAMHADVLASTEAGRERVKSGRLDIDFLRYDWTLNRAP